MQIRGIFCSMAIHAILINSAYAIEKNDLVGKWASEANGNQLTFKPGSDFMDASKGQGRFSMDMVDWAANLVMVYEGNKWCYYLLTIAADRSSFTLLSRKPDQDSSCPKGKYAKIQ